jgi:hypothetical protein
LVISGSHRHLKDVGFFEAGGKGGFESPHSEGLQVQSGSGGQSRRFSSADSDMARKHVIITGTGRAGTSFLVQLLTSLGLDTGYRPEDLEKRLNNVARAGLEQDLPGPDSPYIIKRPRFCEEAEAVLQRGDILLEHVFVPMRDLAAAAESRRFVTREAHAQWSPWKRFFKKVRGRDGVPGGEFAAEQGLSQETLLLQRIYKLVYTLSDTHIPVTFLRYPRLVKDSEYLFQKLSPILNGLGYERFRAVFAQTARPDLVHSFTDQDK